MKPKLRVGVIGSDSLLIEQFERAGHRVREIPLDDLARCVEVDLVVFDDVGPQALPELVAQVAPFARPKQMFLHTELDVGVQVFDEVEVRQSLVLAAHNLFANVWVTSAADEFGEALVNVLIGDIGGHAVTIDDAVRPKLCAARRLRSFEHKVREDAFRLVRAACPEMFLYTIEFLSLDSPMVRNYTAEQYRRDLAAIDEYGDAQLKRLFLDLARRDDPAGIERLLEEER